jgi:hypothetical protein
VLCFRGLQSDPKTGLAPAPVVGQLRVSGA